MLTMDLMGTIPMLTDLREQPIGIYLAGLEKKYHISLSSYAPDGENMGKAMLGFEGQIDNILSLLMDEFNITWDDCEEYIAYRTNILPKSIDIFVFNELLTVNGWTNKTKRLIEYSSPYEYDITYHKDINGEHYEVYLPMIKTFPDIHIRKTYDGIIEPMTSLLSQNTKMMFHQAVEVINSLETD